MSDISFMTNNNSIKNFTIDSLKRCILTILAQRNHNKMYNLYIREFIPSDKKENEYKDIDYLVIMGFFIYYYANNDTISNFNDELFNDIENNTSDRRIIDLNEDYEIINKTIVDKIKDLYNEKTLINRLNDFLFDNKEYIYSLIKLLEKHQEDNLPDVNEGIIVYNYFFGLSDLQIKFKTKYDDDSNKDSDEESDEESDDYFESIYKLFNEAYDEEVFNKKFKHTAKLIDDFKIISETFDKERQLKRNIRTCEYYMEEILELIKIIKEENTIIKLDGDRDSDIQIKIIYKK